MAKLLKADWIKKLNCSLAVVVTLLSLPLKGLAQSPTSPNLPTNAPDTLEQTAPKPLEPLPAQPPRSPQKPSLQTPKLPEVSECITSSSGEPFYVRDVEVSGNTVLQSEIEQEIKRFKRHVVTFEDLVCLRSQITKLYLDQGYITSGAFIPNNQDLNSGIIRIQVVEGELEQIEIKGLSHLKEGYVRDRLKSATREPLNRKSLEESLQLLLLDPLIAKLNAELIAGKTTGSNILILDLEEAAAFKTALTVNNYRSPSIGETQGTIAIGNNNLLGFGDRLTAEYNYTEGLSLYNAGYAFPLNANDGVFTFRYDTSDSDIVEAEFRDVDLESETETFSFGLRQPIVRTPKTELALGLNLDLRHRRTFLEGKPLSFSEGAENGESKVTVLRFSQDWVKRDSTSVLAARSQFNFGLDAFDATINNTGTDGQFFAWQGQFQWVQQLSSSNLLVTRIGGQFTPSSLLSLEKFGLGGVDTVRGYRENQIVADNGIFGVIELRFPVTSNPQTFQLTPFVEVGTGWNNQKPNPETATIASLGLGLRWLLDSNFDLRLDYGIPLVDVNNQDDSIQDKGLHFSFSYQPF